MGSNTGMPCRRADRGKTGSEIFITYEFACCLRAVARCFRVLFACCCGASGFRVLFLVLVGGTGNP